MTTPIMLDTFTGPPGTSASGHVPDFCPQSTAWFNFNGDQDYASPNGLIAASFSTVGGTQDAQMQTNGFLSYPKATGLHLQATIDPANEDLTPVNSTTFYMRWNGSNEYLSVNPFTTNTNPGVLTVEIIVVGKFGYFKFTDLTYPLNTKLTIDAAFNLATGFYIVNVNGITAQTDTGTFTSNQTDGNFLWRTQYNNGFPPASFAVLRDIIYSVDLAPPPPPPKSNKVRLMNYNKFINPFGIVKK